MDTAVINIKIDPDFKYEIQKMASDLGMGVSGFIKTVLKDAIKKKTITLTPYARKTISTSVKDYENGRYVSFDSLDTNLKYLDKIIADDK